MSKLLSKSKWFYYSLGVISALIIISSIFFMSQYKFLRVNYVKENLVAETFFNDAKNEMIADTSKEDWLTKNKHKYEFVDEAWFNEIWDLAVSNPNAFDRNPETNELINKDIKVKDVENVVRYDEGAKLNGASQSNLFNFINQIASRSYEAEGNTDTQKEIDNNKIFSTLLEKDSDGYTKLYSQTYTNGWVTADRYELYQSQFKKVDDFRKSLDSYNNLILAYGIVSLIVFAAFIVLSNHNRRIYYKENLIGGILLPMVNIVFSLILIINGLSLVSNISNESNNALYNVVAAIQNPEIGYKYVSLANSDTTNLDQIRKIINSFNINPTTLICYISFFAITALFNVFLIIVAVLKYKDTEKERKDVLDRARMVGDKV